MKKLFTLFFLSCSVVLSAQNKFKVAEQQCDSFVGISNLEALNSLARSILPAIPKDDWRNQALFHYYIGQSMEMPAEYDTAVYYFEKSVAYARKSKDGLVLGRPLRSLVYAYYAAAEKAKLEVVAKELELMADTTKNEALRVANNSVLANYYAAKGIHEKQLTYLLEDLSYNKKELAKGKQPARYSAYIAEDLVKIAELYNNNLKQPAMSISYLNQARPYISVADKGATVFYYKFYTEALIAMDKPDKAIPYYDSVGLMCTAGLGMACNIRISLDLTLSEYQLGSGKNDQALVFLERAKKMAPEYAQDPTSVTQLQFLEGRVHMANKNFDKALPFLKQAEAGAGNVSLDFYAKAQAALAQCYAGLGQWPQAYSYASRNVLLQDSIYAEKAKQSLANAEARYQNKDKQQQIEKQQIQLTYAGKQRLWLIAGLGLLSLVALLLVVIYRNKKRSADVLDEKNKKLSQLNDELELANQTKAKLFSIISHDLRSPISQVYQFLKLQQLDPDRLNETQKAALNTRIQTATGSLLETMEDLLLWSKTQMNQFNVEMQPVYINDIISDCLKLLQLNSDAKNLEVNTTVTDEVTIHSDPYFLQAIIRNLLQNAIKAAPQNSRIHIDYSNGVLSIRNEGAYFSQNDYEAAIVSEDAGKSLSGLGLRLVDELSRKIGARVSFTDTGGSGTSARLSIG
jgi:signal transduction histidine kinase